MLTQFSVGVGAGNFHTFFFCWVVGLLEVGTGCHVAIWAESALVRSIHLLLDVGREAVSSRILALQKGQNPKRKTYIAASVNYTAIIPILLLAILSGFGMYKPAQFYWIVTLFGTELCRCSLYNRYRQ